MKLPRVFLAIIGITLIAPSAHAWGLWTPWATQVFVGPARVEARIFNNSGWTQDCVIDVWGQFPNGFMISNSVPVRVFPGNFANAFVWNTTFAPFVAGNGWARCVAVF